MLESVVGDERTVVDYHSPESLQTLEFGKAAVADVALEFDSVESGPRFHDGQEKIDVLAGCREKPNMVQAGQSGPQFGMLGQLPHLYREFDDVVILAGFYNVDSTGPPTRLYRPSRRPGRLAEALFLFPAVARK